MSSDVEVKVRQEEEDLSHSTSILLYSTLDY